MVFIKADEQLRLENAVRATLAEQIDAIAAKIPHEDLAIQWDAPAEVGMMERMFPSWYPTTDTTREVTERLAGLAGVRAAFGLATECGMGREQAATPPPGCRVTLTP